MTPHLQGNVYFSQYLYTVYNILFTKKGGEAPNPLATISLTLHASYKGVIVVTQQILDPPMVLYDLLL